MTMDYFRILNLEKEPFSNSPDPGLFFNSKQHLEALQKLEISVRLKRGLSVVTGEVGTGKTTLSRQLIKRISNDPEISFHLVLDPGFSSLQGFLSYVLELFTGQDSSEEENEKRLKEKIKNYLFKQGVDKGKTTVLMIDEGQKLPVFCLEALRELLNYETNDQKLLQIVIFAQEELSDVIAKLHNFKDRIDFRYTLAPLGFKETRNMIRYRIDQASVPGNRKAVFSFAAYLAIFRFTGGYPRKIINICHHILLDMIVGNSSTAGFFLARRCGFKVFPEKRVRAAYGVMAFVLCLFMVTGATMGFDSGWVTRITAEKPFEIKTVDTSVTEKLITNTIPEPLEEPVLEKVKVSEIKPEPATAKDDQTEFVKKPEIYGSLKVSRNETLYKMLDLVYGSFNKPVLDKLLEANPSIKTPDRIMIGMSIDFPVIDPVESVWNDETIFILISENSNFRKAYEMAKQISEVDVRVLPVWTEGKGFIFCVVVDRAFTTKASADLFRKQIPDTFSVRCSNFESASGGKAIL